MQTELINHVIDGIAYDAQKQKHTMFLIYRTDDATRYVVVGTKDRIAEAFDKVSQQNVQFKNLMVSIHKRLNS